jgi:hypothetical protein
MDFNHPYMRLDTVDTDVLDTGQVSSNRRNTYHASSELVTGSGGGLDLDLPINLFRQVKRLRVELEPFELGFYEVCHVES